MSGPCYGQYAVPEAPSAMMALHFHRGGKLRAVDHEPKLAVLDQSDLLAQGIHVSTFIDGAKDVDALGSCTANATAAALSNLLDEGDFYRATGVDSFTDVIGAEKFAIDFYHQCSDQTGLPAQEWPPIDCGSSGPYVVQELQTLGLASGAKIAHGADSIVSLMQDSGLIVGQPFLNAWEQPDALGFIDGNGTALDLERAIRSGVAGGHETHWSAVEHLALDATGHVDAANTIMRARNSWSRSWGDHGSYRFHLSTFVALGQYCDFRSLVA